MTASSQLIAELSAGSESLLAKHSPHAVIAMLDAIDKSEHYHVASDELATTWENIAQEFGSKSFGVFQRIVMLHLMDGFDARAKEFRYVEAIRRCFETSFARIRRNIENPDYADYDSVNDLLLKDLALCRQVLFPAGAQVVQAHSGFERSLMFRGGIKQFCKVLWVLAKTGGNSEFYFYHTHQAELDHFTPQGWLALYLNVADMLKVTPDCRGLVSTPWFLDPALKDVSPRLAYIREQPEKNGASFFRIAANPDSGALAKSATRRRLYEEGKYVPTEYCMVWPRRAMIRWADRYRSQSHHQENH